MTPETKALLKQLKLSAADLLEKAVRAEATNAGILPPHTPRGEKESIMKLLEIAQIIPELEQHPIFDSLPLLWQRAGGKHPYFRTVSAPALTITPIRNGGFNVLQMYGSGGFLLADETGYYSPITQPSAAPPATVSDDDFTAHYELP